MHGARGLLGVWGWEEEGKTGLGRGLEILMVLFYALRSTDLVRGGFPRNFLPLVLNGDEVLFFYQNPLKEDNYRKETVR